MSQGSSGNLRGPSDERPVVHTSQEERDGCQIVAQFSGDWEYWLRPDRTFAYMSPSGESISGYRAEDFYADPGLYLQLVHPEDRAGVERFWNESISVRTDEMRRCEYRIVRRDGQVRWVEHLCHEVLDDRDKLVGWCGTDRDITDRKRAEQGLEAARNEARARLNELHTVIETLFEGLVVSDAANRVLLANSAFRRMVGVDTVFPEMLMDRSEDLEVYDTSGTRVWLENWPTFRAARGEAVCGEELFMRCRRTGKDYVILYNAAPVLNEDGCVRLVITTMHDVTQFKATERALRQARDELEGRVRERTVELVRSNEKLRERSEQLARAASELTLAEQRERQRLARMLHDHLQQLLVAGKLSVRRLARHLPGEGALVGQIEGILDEAVRASRSLTVQLSPPVLREEGFTAGLEWLAGWMEGTHGLKVELEIESGAEPEREDMRIILFESLRELLFNVVKHAGVDRARVEVRREAGQFELVVSDRGRGFDPGAIWGKGREKCGGFGLFSVRERLAFLGGRLAADSAPGEGAEFRLTVPAMGVPADSGAAGGG